MAYAYCPRTLEATLARAAREFPAVVVTGPRQAGKTTLVRRLFDRTHRYHALDAPDRRAAATTDPRGFLDGAGPRVVLDEVQDVPGLLPYLKERIDADRRPGRFILSGSQNLLLARNVAETLAGRAAILTLLPLTRRELAHDPRRPLPWERGWRPTAAPRTGPTLWESFLVGGFPEAALSGPRDLGLWHSSYVQTYLERDVRDLRQVGDLTEFRAFLAAIAARSAQLLNLSDLARDLGIAVNTVKAWLGVLEATHQVVIVRPYHANLTKRLVKRPKAYLADTGLLCHLTGLRAVEQAREGPLAGAIAETAVVNEVRRTLLHRGEPANLYFWRTATGTEVDLLVDRGDRLVPIEVKASGTSRPAMAGAIAALRADLGDRIAPGFVAYAGAESLPLGHGVRAVPIDAL